MIDIKELCIGNKINGVYDQENELSEEVEVACLDRTGEITDYPIWVDGTKEHYDNFEPIKLTEEWFIKWQLQRREIRKGVHYYQYSIRNDFEIYCHMDASGNCLFYSETIRIVDEDFFIRKCNTVHDFQNIYDVLNTHEELTITKLK